MSAFKQIYFDITGYCNARCPYCQTGPGKLRRKKFITVERFKHAVQNLKMSGLVDDKSVIGLYNWGEPFLHPELNSIIAVLNEENCLFSLSTNASIVYNFNSQSLKNLKYLKFSMSGFTQSSYDRIHGFNFSKIQTNVNKIVSSAQKAGFMNIPEILFHVYQFNVNEIGPASNFARKLGAMFTPYYAGLNEWDKIYAAVENNLNYEYLIQASQDVFLHNLRNIKNRNYEGYKCPQWETLVIDEECNVLVCCQTPKYSSSYAMGNLLTDNIENILQDRLSCSVCKKCLISGMAYYINNSMSVVSFDYKSNMIMDKIIKPVYKLIKGFRL